MDADIEYCKKNDRYGLYRLSAEGKISNLAGVDEDYDIPQYPDIIIPSIKKEINIYELINIKNN